jgi:tRNA 5-methylaminomethyl-2-thiouridine biosynthesis bifunctional protein
MKRAARYTGLMPRLLQPPEIDWSGGAPRARGIDDIYFSPDDGLAEARAVFLEGCGLPDAWAGREMFTIAETGFGTGLNFLSAWQLWQEAGSAGWLHFVSFEGFPLLREDAARALAHWPELASLASRLLDVWPGPVAGVRQHVWADARVSLTLHLGQIEERLALSAFRADAWFLDGFAPSKNPDMWRDALFHEIAQRSQDGARAATFTVAGAVRRGLEAAGFAVEKKSGHGRKKERLEARLARAAERPPDIFALRGLAQKGARAAVIGAGIAGACAARALADAGADVCVFEQERAASGASGNPLALVMPRLEAGDGPAARLMIEAYQAARAFYRGRPGVVETSVVQRARHEAEHVRFAKILADPPLPLEDLEAIAGGMLHKRALIVRPAELIGHLLDGLDVRAGAAPDVQIGARRVGVEAFDAIVLADGMQGAARLAFAGIAPRLGQVEFYASVDRGASAAASGDYAVTAGTVRLWGATFEAGDEARVSDAARQENWAALEALAPWWLPEARGAEVRSRAGVRATTPDRLPLVGALPDVARGREEFAGVLHGIDPSTDGPVCEGVFVANGYGARGFTFAPWAGGVLAAMITGAPRPAGRDVLEAASPMRFVLRGLRRGR